MLAVLPWLWTWTVASDVYDDRPRSGVTPTNTAVASGAPAAGGSLRVDPTTDGRADVG